MSGGITIHEMESVARNIDLGNVMDMTDPNDTLGLGMLANSGRSSSSSQAKSFSFNPSGPATGIGGEAPPPSSSGGFFGSSSSSGGGGGLAEIEINAMDSIEPITLNLGGSNPLNGPAAPVEIQFTKAADPPPTSSLSMMSDPYANSQTASGPFSSLAPASAPRLSPEQEKQEKIEMLNKLQRLEAKGMPVSRKFTMDNTHEEIKQEFNKLVDARNLEASIRFQRQALMSVVTGLEWMNGRFDPFDLKMDGWSESVHENVEDFDEIFEELYDKYKERGKLPPEARLVMALAGSGFMCHVSNTFLRSRMPNMDDVLRQNPEIARQFATAAAKQAGPGFGNFMSMAMNSDAGAGPGAAPPQQAAGAFFGSSQAPPMAQMPQSVAAMEPPTNTARREMKGPTGVDDILNTFEQVRRSEMQPQMSANPDTQPALAAIELQSLGSDDIGSTTDSRRSGRGRRRATPVGNTMSINV
jgi:hypothetical protein